MSAHFPSSCSPSAATSTAGWPPSAVPAVVSEGRSATSVISLPSLGLTNVGLWDVVELGCDAHAQPCRDLACHRFLVRLPGGVRAGQPLFTRVADKPDRGIGPVADHSLLARAEVDTHGTGDHVRDGIKKVAQCPCRGDALTA